MTTHDIPAGDRGGKETHYEIIKGEIVGDLTRGYETIYTRHFERYPDAMSAFRAGVKMFGHDDFNTAEMQGGRLVRILWRTRDLGESQEELDKTAVQIGAAR